ncbi:MAG: pentapeptide repeat-containing protein, partial [Rhodospirillales bacterium]|nr:pentapeptide repeat-containing protein [Rhodospirillales bacterium]
FNADVAVVQLGHEDFSGADFAQSIRQSDRSPNTDLPIVLIVDTPNPDLLKRACEAGIEGVVSRPTKPEVFLDRIADAITGNRRMVSTDDYFGPNRRKEPKAGYGGPERRVVDLTLRRGTEVQVIQPKRSALPVAAPSKRTKIREWGDDAIPAPEKAKRTKRDWPEETVPETNEASRHSDEAWADAMTQAETPSPAEPEFRLAPLIERHQTWLKTRGAEGEKIDLTGTDLTGQSLADSNLTNARLREADLSDSDCRNAVLSSADLRRAELSGADLTGADLSVANLRLANLKLAKLADASFRGADLAGAQFGGSTIANTDFASANMLDADLDGADLRQAAGLVQKQIDKTRCGTGTKLPPGLHRPERD